MIFTTIEFVFFFLPIVLLVNYCLPKKIRNVWLLVASLFFYGWGEPKFLIVMIGTILFNYVSALLVVKLKKQGNKEKVCKAFMALVIVLNLSALFIYKYMNFSIEIMHRIFPVTERFVEQTQLVLPIGISFFTFQAISYVIDVYRGSIPQKNPIHLGLYIACFPQLIAGPIVRYNDVSEQLKKRKIDFDKFSYGVRRFICGFNKKVLLSNNLAIVADVAWNAEQNSVLMAWLGAVCYTLQIYFDFSGYSDMAIGLGKMLGFDFCENFNYPYISKSISEFWRRWHISLGSWFRDYLYIPLGGNRVQSKKRLIINLLVVWTVTGIWHGAGGGFLLWGLMYGVLIAVEKTFHLPEKLSKKKIGTIIYQIFTMLVVVMGWVLFRSGHISTAMGYFLNMFGIKANGIVESTMMFYLHDYWVFILAGLIGAMPIFRYLKKWVSGIKGGENAYEFSACVMQAILFVISISCLVMDAHNPFIYFNF